MHRSYCQASSNRVRDIHTVACVRPNKTLPGAQAVLITDRMKLARLSFSVPQGSHGASSAKPDMRTLPCLPGLWGWHAIRRQHPQLRNAPLPAYIHAEALDAAFQTVHLATV